MWSSGRMAQVWWPPALTALKVPDSSEASPLLLRPQQAMVYPSGWRRCQPPAALTALNVGRLVAAKAAGTPPTPETAAQKRPRSPPPPTPAVVAATHDILDRPPDPARGRPDLNVAGFLASRSTPNPTRRAVPQTLTRQPNLPQ